MIRLRRPTWGTLREGALTVTALLGLACIAATLAALLLDVRPVVFRSGSMSPSITTGSLAFARTTPAADLGEGDVVTVRTGSGVNVTHRIVAVSHQGEKATLVLKGDANRVADDHAYVVSKARRVLFSVPRAGYVVTWASSSAGVFLGGLVAGAALLLIFRRTPPGGRAPRDADVTPPEAPHRPKRGVPGRFIVALVAVGLLAVTAWLGNPASTSAYYTDAAGLTGGTFTRPSLPPVINSCVVGNGNSITATISWTFTGNPDHFEVRYNNGTPTQSFAGNLRTGLLTAPMNNIAGEFWIVAVATDGTTSPDSGHYAYSGVGGRRQCAPA